MSSNSLNKTFFWTCHMNVACIEMNKKFLDRQWQINLRRCQFFAVQERLFSQAEVIQLKIVLSLSWKRFQFVTAVSESWLIPNIHRWSNHLFQLKMLSIFYFLLHQGSRHHVQRAAGMLGAFFLHRDQSFNPILSTGSDPGLSFIPLLPLPHSPARSPSLSRLWPQPSSLTLLWKSQSHPLLLSKPTQSPADWGHLQAGVKRIRTRASGSAVSRCDWAECVW